MFLVFAKAGLRRQSLGTAAVSGVECWWLKLYRDVRWHSYDGIHNTIRCLCTVIKKSNKKMMKCFASIRSFSWVKAHIGWGERL